VHIVTRKHLKQAMENYPDAADEIKAWIGIVEKVRWHILWKFAVRSRMPILLMITLSLTSGIIDTGL
jgi:hypothetical protein